MIAQSHVLDYNSKVLHSKINNLTNIKVGPDTENKSTGVKSSTEDRIMDINGNQGQGIEKTEATKPIAHHRLLWWYEGQS